MKRCPVCGKDRSEFEMRPIVNVEELAMGDAVSDASSKEDVGGAKLHVVCRSCWLALLESRTKEEVVDLLETISGILFEVARRQAEHKWPDGFVLEKAEVPPAVRIQPMPNIYPTGHIWVDPYMVMPGGGQWTNGTRIDPLSQGGSCSNSLNLAEQFGNLMFGEDFHLGPNWTEGDNDGGEPVSSG